MNMNMNMNMNEHVSLPRTVRNFLYEILSEWLFPGHTALHGSRFSTHPHTYTNVRAAQHRPAAVRPRQLGVTGGGDSLGAEYEERREERGKRGEHSR
jgi:hypothetical protein